MNKSPLSEEDTSASLLALQRKERHLLLLLGEKKVSKCFVGLIEKRKIQESLGIFELPNPKR